MTMNTEDDLHNLNHYSSCAIAGAAVMGAALGVAPTWAAIIPGNDGKSYLGGIPDDHTDADLAFMQWAANAACQAYAFEPGANPRNTGYPAALADLPTMEGDTGDVAFDPMKNDAARMPDPDTVQTFMRSMPQVQSLALSLMLDRHRFGPGHQSALDLTVNNDDADPNADLVPANGGDPNDSTAGGMALASA
jgi:hypothetical protein